MLSFQLPQTVFFLVSSKFEFLLGLNSHCYPFSYLHRSPGTSTPDDSSSVESEIDEDNTTEKNIVQEDMTGEAREYIYRNKVVKKNGMVKDMEVPRMKKVSVEMKKMRKERWSLDGSSGDEGGR